jgi:hypothetical protein
MLELAFPLTGDVLVLNPPGHHRYAFDCVQVRDRRRPSPSDWRWLLGRARLGDWAGWASQVRAPVGANVVAARDGVPDRQRFSVVDMWDAYVRQPRQEHDDPMALAGNYIVLRAGPVAILLAHLRCGSIRVARGDRVCAGDPIGEVGASGNAVAPHLHLETREEDICDGAPVPFAVKSLGRPLARVERIHVRN